jgi:hypothetical protein
VAGHQLLLLPKWGRGDGPSFEREWDVAFGQLKSESAVAHDTFILHFGVRACRVSCYQAVIGPLGGSAESRWSIARANNQQCVALLLLLNLCLPNERL